jgi:hypothetical protein
MAAVREGDYSRGFYGGFSETDLTVWRFVRDQGGYWTAPELMRDLPQAGNNAQEVAGRLKRLYSAGHLARRSANVPIRYGVTTTCQAPMRESMTPVISPVISSDQAATA